MVGAFDLISRAAMLGALRDVAGGSQALPFVRLFCGQSSQFLWADDMGTVHHVDQGEGGEQGDALMPLLFSLGAFEAAATSGRRRAVVHFPRRCVRDHSQPRQGGSHPLTFWTLNCIVTPESIREAPAQIFAMSQSCLQRSKVSHGWAHLLAGRSLFTHS